MLKELRQAVYEANMELPRRGLVTYTWGNVSGIDRERGLVIIKPSGVEYDALTPEQLVVLNLQGEVVEGTLKPWGALFIPTVPMRWAGLRREKTSRPTAPPTRTTFTAPSPAPGI